MIFRNKREAQEKEEQTHEQQRDKRVRDKEIYKRAAQDFEVSQYRRLRVTNFMLWIYSLLTTITIAILGLAIHYLTPLKERVPYLIRVDSSTGIAETLTQFEMQNAHFNQNEREALDRYFLGRYIHAAEGYNYNLRTANYNEILMMSSPVVGETYRQSIETRNPKSPINVLGKTSTAEITIRSISWPDTDGKEEKTAHVRFIRQIKSLTNSETTHPPEYYLATINYRYEAIEMSTSVRQINPMGFFVTAYSVVPEVQ